MTKSEFLDRIKKENIQLGQWLIILDEVNGSPFVMGCQEEDGKWKIYKTGERHGHYIFDEYDNENIAFDEFYELIKFEERMMEGKYRQYYT